MEKQEKVDVFATPVFNRAAWLMMNGFDVCDIDKSNRGRMIFMFENSEKLQEVHENFWQQHDIQKFVEAQQLLKTRMYIDNPPAPFASKENEQPKSE